MTEILQYINESIELKIGIIYFEILLYKNYE
jgi:hypothetical protein